MRKVKISNDKQTRFWENVWLGNKALVDEFPALYGIVRKYF